MDCDHNLHPGATMVPDAVRACRMVTEQSSTEKLIINGDEIDGITLDPENKDFKKIPGSLVLTLIREELNKRIDDLKFNIETEIFNPVLSSPILDEHFYGSHWCKTDNLRFDNSKAIYINELEPKLDQARIKIPTSAFTKIGKYFASIEVEEFPSGLITITNEKGTLLKSIISPGSYQFEFTVDNTSTAFVLLTINNMDEFHTCVITSFSINYIRSIFDTYIEYKLKDYVFGDANNSLNELKAYVEDSILKLQEYVKAATVNLEALILEHTKDKNNPHKVTKEQLGI